MCWVERLSGGTRSKLKNNLFWKVRYRLKKGHLLIRKSLILPRGKLKNLNVG